MSQIELFLIAIGLSMDAFAVSVGKGLSMKKINAKNTLTIGVWFGAFQALMPFIGFFLGSHFASLVQSVDHWIAFVLLSFIGSNMIRESIQEETDETEEVVKLDPKTMLMLAIATSIDALAVGVTFAFLRVNIFSATTFIGCTTFIISGAGVIIGNLFGGRLKSKAEVLGGLILIFIGVRTLIMHLFFA